jgi:hypothetical protein
MLLVGVVPFWEQFSEQQRRALATCGVLLLLSAALQQSISPIAPPMLHDCSPECRGVPAKAPLATINKSTSDENRVLMATDHSMENNESMSRPHLGQSEIDLRVAYLSSLKAAHCGDAKHY